MHLINFFRFNKYRRILQKAAKEYRNQKSHLSSNTQQRFKENLIELQEAIEKNDIHETKAKSKELEQLSKKNFKTSWFKWAFEGIFALAFALIIAIIIRQVWFELYEIPTGSMRPTFKEQDHLTVSKTQFGINRPLETDHFYFDPNLVQRMGTIIFSGDGIPLMDTDTKFLGILPYKKRYVKRLIGKPQDILTFYGGQIYLWDGQGNFQENFIDSSVHPALLSKIEHIPFISFEVQPELISNQEYILKYFNTPFGKITRTSENELKGEVFNGKNWVPDDLTSLLKPHNDIQSLADILGFKNYAMTQLYSKKDLEKEGLNSHEDSAEMFLVLRHTPHLDFTKGPHFSQRIPKVLTTVLPLNSTDLKQIMNSMYTARFVVEQEKVKQYSYENSSISPNAPRLKNVPDGTYEFYYGIAYKVHFGGITSELPKDDPLYSLSNDNIKFFYNLGIRFDNAYQPGSKANARPNRYAYYRNGDFYVLGMPLLKKDDPRLQAFIENEENKQSQSSKNNPYIAFIDHHAPTLETAKAQGLKIPKNNYIVLGDNHAMSGDSRMFGFVPQNNLQGIPDIILWPPGNRLGHPLQEPYPIFVFPRLIIWLIASIIGLVTYSIYCYRLRKKVEL